MTRFRKLDMCIASAIRGKFQTEKNHPAEHTSASHVSLAEPVPVLQAFPPFVPFFSGRSTFFSSQHAFQMMCVRAYVFHDTSQDDKGILVHACRCRCRRTYSECAVIPIVGCLWYTICEACIIHIISMITTELVCQPQNMYHTHSDHHSSSSPQSMHTTSTSYSLDACKLCTINAASSLVYYAQRARMTTHFTSSSRFFFSL